MTRKMILILIAAILTVLSAGVSHAGDDDLWTVATTPDALIILDLTGSMADPPQGQNANYFVSGSNCTVVDGPYYLKSGTGHTRACIDNSSNAVLYVNSTIACNTSSGGPFYAARYTDPAVPANSHDKACYNGSADSTHYGTSIPKYSDSTCGEPFYKTSGTGHTTSCSNTFSNPAPEWGDATCTGAFYRTTGTGHAVRCEKVDIAKYALWAILNDSNTDGLNQINAADNLSLAIRLGLMRYSCSSASASTHYSTDKSSCINLSWPITSDVQTTPTPYSSIYCNNTTSCASTVTSCSSTPAGKECIVGFSAANSTPLAYALKEAKLYLDAHKALDDSQSCRQKSVIVITDGEDTLYNCSGLSGAALATARAKASVMYAKALADAKYNVYVVGFGSAMPAALQNTLNWMAVFGKTDNPSVANTGSTTAVTVSTAPCTSSNGTDPQTKDLTGYAFMASNPAELAAALRAAITSIISANYSFSSQASVAAARASEENFIYEASFEPKNSAGASKEPFWTGHLKKYVINSAGALMFPAAWDAGTILRDTAASSRNMLTYKGSSSLTSFNTTNITAADLAVATDTRRNEVVGFYRGEPAYNLENWKLGDLFHTNPMAVKTPTKYFYDPRECTVTGTPTSFDIFRDNNPRTAATGNQLMLAGANDGQLHAFRTQASGGDETTGGDERWSFIPPNLLQKISPIAHAAGSAGPPIVPGHDYNRSQVAAHDYFIDGPIQVADAYLAVPSTGTYKNKDYWKTIAVFGEGAGSGNYLWSSNPTCYSTNTTYFSGSFSTTLPTSSNPTKYYCGFYALNVTNTSAPEFLWHLMPTTAQAPYLGEAWSKMQIGRVKIGGNEQWVGFIGGGYNNSILPAGSTAGKGFFVVDLTNGNILWSYTHADNGDMDFSAPASPTILDLDSDGFIDTVYMGDLGGNMWRFRLCPRVKYETCGLSSYSSSCGTGNWAGSRLYATTADERGTTNTQKQIFTKVTSTIDSHGDVWVYFGTGENNDPTRKPTLASPDTSVTKNRLYGIKEDTNFTNTYTTTNLKDITSTIYCAAVNTDLGCGGVDSQQGWYINLSTNSLYVNATYTITGPRGEKMISDPIVFDGIVYFPTYVPDQGGASACGLAGNAFLYALDYVSGSGANEGGSRTSWMGLGIASSILVSFRPGGSGVADIYFTTSGGAGIGGNTGKGGETKSENPTSIQYWRDRRL